MFLCIYFEIILSFDIEGRTPDSTTDYLDKTKKKFDVSFEKENDPSVLNGRHTRLNNLSLSV